MVYPSLWEQCLLSQGGSPRALPQIWLGALPCLPAPTPESPTGPHPVLRPHSPSLPQTPAMATLPEILRLFSVWLTGLGLGLKAQECLLLACCQCRESTPGVQGLWGEAGSLDDRKGSQRGRRAGSETEG